MPDLEFDSIIVDIQKLIEKDQKGALLNILIDLHPVDIEDILNRLKKEDRKYLFNLLPTELASEVLIELDTPVVEQVLEEASEQKISTIVDQMDSDDAADIVAELPAEVAGLMVVPPQLRQFHGPEAISVDEKAIRQGCPWFPPCTMHY